jgi:hypothetical protein
MSVEIKADIPVEEHTRQVLKAADEVRSVDPGKTKIIPLTSRR